MASLRAAHQGERTSCRLSESELRRSGDLVGDGLLARVVGPAHDDLEALLDELTSREAAVIRLRYGLEDDTPQTLSQIGEDLQLSRERVRQIETRALLKLRQPQRRCRVHDYLNNLDRDLSNT